MLEIATFAVVQFLASGFACWRGGAPERTVGVLLALAFAASMATPLLPAYTYLDINQPLLRIDLMLLAGLIVVALYADRYWPMWMAALQLVTIGGHAVRLYSSAIVPVAYWSLTAKIAYPMVLVLVVGVVRHRQRELSGLPEFSWTRQRCRHGHDATD